MLLWRYDSQPHLDTTHTPTTVPERADGEGLGQLDDYGPGSQLMAGVARVPVIVARVSVEQGVSAATDALHDAGARRNGCHVFSGHCGQEGMLTAVIIGLGNARCDLPKRPLSRVNGRSVNMHSNATRWKTLLTVLCVPTIRMYLKHTPPNVTEPYESVHFVRLHFKPDSAKEPAAAFV